MCLSFPGKIVRIKGDNAIVDYIVEKRTARLVDKKFKVEDYVIVQNKIVVEKVEQKPAEKWIETIKAMVSGRKTKTKTKGRKKLKRENRKR